MRKDKTPVFYWIFAIGAILFGVMSVAYPLATGVPVEGYHICSLVLWFALAAREIYCFYLYFIKEPRKGNDKNGEENNS